MADSDELGKCSRRGEIVVEDMDSMFSSSNFKFILGLDN